jgi:hypothetical protein
LDNIGPIDRSHLPAGGTLEQSDATGWMAYYAIAMAAISVVLQRGGRRPAVDLVVKFLEHFASISEAIDAQGLWDETDGLYYDRLLTADGTSVPVKARSMVSVIPALTAAAIDEPLIERSLTLGKNFAEFIERRGLADEGRLRAGGLLRGEPGGRRLLLSVVGPGRLERILARLFDPAEFLSPHGLRALSAYHRDHPYQLDVDGSRSQVDYEPAESTTAMFGGNSNWRGPLWFPLNYLLITALERYHAFFGDDLLVEYPTGSPAAACPSTTSPGTCRTASSPCSCPAPTAGARASERWTACSTTRSGKTTWYSASTSTATTAPASAPPTRPAGPA